MKKIIMLSGFSLVLSACTQSTPAEITDISNMTSSSEIVSSSYIEPPKNISSGNQGFLSQPRVTSADIESPDMSSSEFTSSDVAPSELDSSETPPSRRTSSERVLSETTSSDADNNKIITTREQISYNRNYEDIPKGGYKGNSYQVKRGDTLFYIAWVTGNDYRALASKNNIPEPYALREGQVLNVGGGETVVVTEKKTTQAEINKQNSMKAASKTASTAKTTTNTSKTPTTSSTVDNVSWRWPARGRVIEKFSKATKGIDIAGTLGDRVSSAADGRVVYAGNALPGYGNLIIIKHNDDYLTAYAHNQTMLVKEQQAVKAGQQIATMGATGTSSVRLHFEIRYRAESVNPLKYLPGR